MPWFVAVANFHGIKTPIMGMSKSQRATEFGVWKKCAPSAPTSPWVSPGITARCENCGERRGGEVKAIPDLGSWAGWEMQEVNCSYPACLGHTELEEPAALIGRVPSRPLHLWLLNAAQKTLARHQSWHGSHKEACADPEDRRVKHRTLEKLTLKGWMEKKFIMTSQKDLQGGLLRTNSPNSQFSGNQFTKESTH